jgi:hypothetical protein
MDSAAGPKSFPTIIRQADQDITSLREALGIATLCARHSTPGDNLGLAIDQDRDIEAEGPECCWRFAGPVCSYADEGWPDPA